MTYDELMDRLYDMHGEYCDLRNDSEPCGCAFALLMGELYATHEAALRQIPFTDDALPDVIETGELGWLTQ
jgi:hypothetical protein